MMTENLQEMIQEAAGNPIGFDDPDFIYQLPRKKLTYDEVKNEALNAEKGSTAADLIKIEIPGQSSATEVDTSNFQPESEEALIAYAMDIHKRVQTFSIGGYWEIGRTLNSFYQGKYGAKELERISVATGIGRDTLSKMCKFAKKYSRDQVETLLSETFPISWFHIAQNLSIEPDKMIQVCQEIEDPKQFYNLIIRLKDPSESRGKSKPSKVIEVGNVEKSIAVAAEITPSVDCKMIFPICDEPRKRCETCQKELEMLKMENERLKEELSDVQREKEHYENSYYVYMAKLDKVKSALENNTPGRTILEWIDNGDDE